MSSLNTMECLRVFKRVVEVGSFTGAAKDLGLSVAWTAKQVERLEAHLDATLFVRSTRKLTLTDAGRMCHTSAIRILDEMHALGDQLQENKSDPTGRLKISVPQVLAIYGMGEIIGNFSRTYPRIEFDISVNDRFVDVPGEGFDLALRLTTRLADSDNIVRTVGPVRRILCASPAYISTFGAPADAAELGNHRCAVFSWSSDPVPWSFEQSGVHVAVQPKITVGVNSSPMIREVVLSGSAIGIVPEYVIREDLKAGRMVRILPDLTPAPLHLYLLRARNRFLPARTRLLADYLHTSLRELIS